MSVEETAYSISLLAPVSGQILALEELEDGVFSQRLLGDGIAVRPVDGTICAPAEGTVGSVLPALHAYTFTTRQGLELLVHVGLDSGRLQGQGFRCFVQPGETVKAGQVIAEADLTLMKDRGLRTETMLILCEGAEACTLKAASGTVLAGEDAVLTLYR